MKLFTLFLWVIGSVGFYTSCSNQKANERGKLRLYTVLVPKADILSLSAEQIFYFNIDFENRKIRKERIRLLGYHVERNRYNSDTIQLPTLNEDTVVQNDKFFGNYHLSANLVDTIKKMEGEGELEGIDFIVLKPVVFDTSRNYIHYDVLVGLKQSDLNQSNDRSQLSVKSSSLQALTLRSIGRLDPSPPAPPPN